MSTHTPGPWHVDKSLRRSIYDANGVGVGEAWHGVNEREYEEETANAHLMAAAPAMYGLLVELYDTTLDPDIVRILQPWFAKVETIIESVEGDA